ncbi:MAG: ABC transporter permease [Lachnospiraceae bacterium]|nr:ABC transporter permease [Lachnospiraceae bacterium]
MFFAETRKKYFNIVFLFVIIIGGFWLYSSLKPTASTDDDYYKYNYFKPLNEAEFVYFELVSEYKKGVATAFIEPKGNRMWGTYGKILNDTEKEYLLEVVKKINPSYKNSEKMKDVKINFSYSDIKPYLKELEEKLHIYSLYYTGMNSTRWYNSPYHVYTKCTGRFHGREYNDALKEFTLTYEHGISDGYAYVFLDNCGIIMGFIAIIYSFMSYTEEKRKNVNGYIYTANVSSSRYVLHKYLADTMPLMLASIIYSLLGAACFIYWNYKFNYGYDISIIPFLIKTPFIIFPTILIVTAIGHFLGILFCSETLDIIAQFILFYLSMGYGLSDKFNFALLIRYNNFDDYTLYQNCSGNVIINRVIIILLSVILTGFTVVLFNYRREHGRLINLKNIKKFAVNILPLSFKKTILKKKKQETKNFVTRGIGYYMFKQSASKMALLYIPYLCIILPVVIFQEMNTLAIAITGENIFIFASMFLFIRLGNMEKANGTESYVFTSDCLYPLVYIIRVASAGITLFIMVEIPVLVLCLVNHVPAGRWCIGVYLSSLFIGMFSLLITEVSESCLAGYFSYIIYYLFDIVSGGNMPLSIAGYTYQLQKTKLYLGAAVAIIAIILLFVVYNKAEGKRLIRKNENRD